MKVTLIVIVEECQGKRSQLEIDRQLLSFDKEIRKCEMPLWRNWKYIFIALENDGILVHIYFLMFWTLLGNVIDDFSWV